MSAVDPKVKNTTNTPAIEPSIYSCSAQLISFKNQPDVSRAPQHTCKLEMPYIKILNDSTLEILYNDFLFMKYKHFPHDSCPKSHLLQQVHNLLNFANI